MVDYKSMSVADIRQDLIDRFGLSPEDVAKMKGKANLVKLHQELTNLGLDTTEEKAGELDVVSVDDSIMLDNTVTEQEEDVKSDGVPEYTSEDWHEYVMQQFTEEELHEGNPTIAGLRRVAEKLLGNIISSGPITVYPSNDADGPGRATVVYEVVFEWIKSLGPYIDITKDGDVLPKRVFRAVGTSWHGTAYRSC